MTKNISGILIMALVLTNISCATLSPDREYFAILKDIRNENVNFGFMKLSNYLREHPETKYSPDIKFAIAEYYFQIQDYYDAASELNSYITDYPESKNIVFAYALLYKISLEYADDPQLLEKIKESFFNKSLFLVFSESKTKSYNSLLNNEYKFVEYIDRVEVFKNNELFIKITP